MITAAFVTGFAAGCWVVGVFAPWLVADTADRLEEEYEKLTKENDK